VCNTSVQWKLVLAIFVLLGVAASQSTHKTRSLVVNGHRGDVIVYQIDGKSFVELDTLVRITNGSLSFHNDQMVLNLPVASDPVDDSPTSASSTSAGLSPEFMREAVHTLAAMKDWMNTVAYAATHGVPGDGSRLVVFHDQAAVALRLSKVAASSASDRSALHLLENQFNSVNGWNDKLIHERRIMDTGKYSMSANALSSDENYLKLSNCATFLDNMISTTHFHDDYACH